MSAQQLTANRNVGPFMHKNYEECYCNSLSSQDTEKVISFCGGSYRQCQVYQAKFFSKVVVKAEKCAKKY